MRGRAGERTGVGGSVLGAGLLAGAANVIMQLSHPGVGRGVVESRVDSGNLFKRPVKRTRTTVTYLAVALLGTDEERAAFRRAVNKQHAQVRSTERSPVRYNAFDPELQLWVAACLYKGVEDTNRIFGGVTDPDQLDELYRSSAVLGTTLQVRPDMWPADRAEFERYWDKQLAEVRIDDAVRELLHDVASLKFLPNPLSAVLGPVNAFLTTGFLPPKFREEMQLRWSDADQARFDRIIRVVAAVVNHIPLPMRGFPFNLALWDLRKRMRRGMPLA
ncbi:oxygenase MpaB family protein [Saccharopolyspora mangrovi]|uniref:Oxygenase MpaB family protein n=1 Tax=Saccharopolyspora mangrovi TaxID=3082379 RepID=A0ABU6ABT6_9PSEU|nr:oxygenase MpaB family protein [Saccharopolyspora sp. S2-29]MEB3369021.1 oxygenase MpaB family protein [Saccharopolyspora sp. S2-29]